MLSTALQDQIVDYIARESRHVDDRGYVGLSGIGDCARVIYDRYFTGDRASQEARIKHAWAYNIEGIMTEYLMQMGIYRRVSEICLHDGLVQGHPDGEISGELLEIKTVEISDHLPIPPRLPNRAFYQVQAYMHYLGFQRCQVVYISRDIFHIRVIGVSYAPAIGQRIEAKVARLVQAIQTNTRPSCECGRCKE
jgi:hypothetical protein